MFFFRMKSSSVGRDEFSVVASRLTGIQHSGIPFFSRVLCLIIPKKKKEKPVYKRQAERYVYTVDPNGKMYYLVIFM